MTSLATTKGTLAGALWPAGETAGWLRNAILAVAGSLFVALCSQITVPLWPVPITGQTFAVLVIGMAYGWRLGSATLLLYLAQGALGLPVFAKFAGGAAVLMGPTGGYLVGFVLAAGLVGYLAERGWDRSVFATAAAMLLGNVLIYLPGLAWLALFYAGPGAQFVTATGAESAVGAAVAAGALPFLLGDALKLALAAAALPLIWRGVARRG
ncbi:MAG: biotin transporter BioY [Kiloniellales bacterium]|nr:biotin transporter BioY [Kiloniellales bacterium]